MFKKILDAILDLKNDTNSNLRSISGAMSNTIKMDNTIEELTEMLKCQLKLLDQVINNSFEKNNTELDTVVLIP